MFMARVRFSDVHTQNDLLVSLNAENYNYRLSNVSNFVGKPEIYFVRLSPWCVEFNSFLNYLLAATFVIC